MVFKKVSWVLQLQRKKWLSLFLKIILDSMFSIRYLQNEF